MMGILSPTLWNIPLLGASGGVFAIILACAVLFPHIRLILLLFPVPIRFAAALIFAISVFYILIDIRNAIIGGTVGRAISDAAHFGGMVAAGLWIWGLPKLRGAAGDARARRNRGAWEQKLKKRTQQRVEIDRILEKIFADGAYGGDKLRKAMAGAAWTIEVVKRSDTAKGFEPIPKRWVVERTIAWINRCRRLAKDYENLNRTALAFVRLASIRLMLRRLTRFCYPS